MANSRDILLKLVRIAMGWENDFSLPQDVEWAAVFDLAKEHGVVAIVLDGLDVCQAKNPEINLISKKDKPLLLEAIGLVQAIEINHQTHLTALNRLAKILDGYGVPFILMKGFSCGQYYPIPKHRECGDIDIYPGDKFEESNRALVEAGIEIDDHYYRHTVSIVNGVMVENHRVLGDLRGPKKQTKEFEQQLEGEAEWSMYFGKRIVVGDNTVEAGRYPTADFNALFLPWHVSAHFMFERVTLRHLLDWALFLVNDGKNINVEKFSEAKRRYTFGYGKIADILTNLSLRYLNMPTNDVPDAIITDACAFDNSLSDKVFDYMFTGQPRERDKNVWKFRLNNVKRIWKERWKYKEVYDTSVLMFTIRKVWGVLYGVGE